MNMDNENDKINSQETEETTPVQTEPQQDTAEKGTGAEPEQHKVKEFFGSTKFKRGGITTAFTAGFLIVIVLLNVIVGILVQRYPSINLDMTKDNSNTLSEQAIKVVDSVKQPITLSIMATEEQTKNDQVLSEYGLKYSQVGTLAAKMAERNSNIKVEYIDLVKNPSFAAEHKNDNLQQGDVLVHSDKRDRVLTYSELFNVQYNQDGSSNSYSLVDSALASGVNAAISDTMPVAAFDTGHSEQLDATTYKQLLSSNSFETKDFNLLTDAVPDKTQMIVLGCPTTDYTDEEIKKLDDFLSSSKLAGDRSLVITFHPSQKEMPKLASFLQEWGIEVPPASYVVESDQNKYFNDPSNIFATVGSDISLNGKTDYGYFITPQASSIKLLFQNKGTKTTYSLAKSSDTSYLVSGNTKASDNPAKAAYNTAALSQDTVKSGDKTYKSNVIALGSTLMFDSQILAATTFGNGRFVVDLAKYATGTANSATAVTSTSVQTNVSDITLPAGAALLLGFGVFTVLIPLLIAIAGIIVFRKRRHL